MGNGLLHADLFYAMATRLCGDDEWQSKRFLTPEAAGLQAVEGPLQPGRRRPPERPADDARPRDLHPRRGRVPAAAVRRRGSSSTTGRTTSAGGPCCGSRCTATAPSWTTSGTPPTRWTRTSPAADGVPAPGAVRSRRRLLPRAQGGSDVLDRRPARTGRAARRPAGLGIGPWGRRWPCGRSMRRSTAVTTPRCPTRCGRGGPRLAWYAERTAPYPLTIRERRRRRPRAASTRRSPPGISSTDRALPPGRAAAGGPGAAAAVRRAARAEPTTTPSGPGRCAPTSCSTPTVCPGSARSTPGSRPTGSCAATTRTRSSRASTTWRAGRPGPFPACAARSMRWPRRSSPARWSCSSIVRAGPRSSS